MRYQASVTDFFKAPAWRMNLLLGGVCTLIPLVGPIVLSGWAITVLWGRGDDAPAAQAPAFDFEHFTKYLMRGLWPMLASMACSVVFLIPLMALIGGVAALWIPLAKGSAAPPEAIVVIGGLLYVALILALNLVLVPVMIAGTLTQNFAGAFNPGFIGSFLRRMWLQVLAVFLFMFGMGILMVVIAIPTCYLGFFAAYPLVLFSWHHLQQQLYRQHVAGGGLALVRSQKLSDLPPPLPG